MVPLPRGVGEVPLEELREARLRHGLEAREREEVLVRGHLVERLAVVLERIHEGRGRHAYVFSNSELERLFSNF